ncbi:MAG: coenzyme F420-0:L-glutamate ligase [Ezakiella sp.]|uniref:coenzyme F420-0:L-glutamate ligase n=1 Tax=Ezakiella sp. TaxID=1935205 RepID=UPI0029763323|nr:coenzyme F420-0:L-glutamate ligase [Ezakiella sp.]MDD7731185.1 coenzyme F420-0:L-glutamate ligase [Eubacteriales bacterium]MDY6079766.1 coenzyme F420-0:L-glutamate ligase [Ezakiella sp.]
MSRFIGTVSRGIRTKIIKKGDNLSEIVVNSVMDAVASENIPIHDRDIVGVTEAVLARSQGNYANTDEIGADIRKKFGGDHIGLIFPILSRNRFSVCLKGIAKGAKKITLMLSYPADEVGNHLLTLEQLDEAGMKDLSQLMTEKEYRDKFGKNYHPFTHVDYVEFYRELIEAEGAECEIVFSNDPLHILNYTNKVLTADIHSRKRTKKILKDAGALVYNIEDVLNEPVGDSGYNKEYGLLGANKSTEDSVKLFPRDSFKFANDLQERFKEATGKNVEVLVYGDGAFKDSVGQIWELADPVVSPGYTKGLEGVPNELKLKYLADNDFKDLKGEELNNAILEKIKHKYDENAVHNENEKLGTTPRKLTDLIGSLCDLTSGSGDKGTPIILIQGYFDNLATE